MKSVTSPGGLLAALLLAGIVAVDVVVFDSYSTATVLLAGFLCAVLVAGSFSPFAESRGYRISVLVAQVATATALAYRGTYALAAILAVASLGTVQRLRGSDS